MGFIKNYFKAKREKEIEEEIRTKQIKLKRREIQDEQSQSAMEYHFKDWKKEEQIAEPDGSGNTSILTGEDARAFHEYMENPKKYETPEGKELMKEALEISKDLRFLHQKKHERSHTYKTEISRLKIRIKELATNYQLAEEQVINDIMK
jgi:hypothetical protein